MDVDCTDLYKGQPQKHVCQKGPEKEAFLEEQNKFKGKNT
jgi:hypothetical protein